MIKNVVTYQKDNRWWSVLLNKEFCANAISLCVETSPWGTSLLKATQFRNLKTCLGKFDCLVYDMLFIKERNPSLNTHTDSMTSG